ncbi:4-hydroxy-tetrahydrodipicolinate synthase [Caproiciproducens sp.]
MEKPITLKGIFPALVCSFDANNHLDEEAIRENIRFALDNGCAGVVANGSTGEAINLSREEKKRVAEISVEECHARGKKVISGCGGPTTSATLELVKDALEVGVDAGLVITPFNNIPNQNGLIAHYSQVASLGLPIILYNIPSHTSVNIDMDTFNKLIQLPNVIGIKESSGNLYMMAEIVRKYGTDITIFTGCDELTLQIFSTGASAAVLALANIAPAEVVSILENVQAGKLDKARETYYKLLPIAHVISADENFPATVKEAVSQLGHRCGAARLPIIPCSEQEKKEIHDALAYAGLLK